MMNLMMSVAVSATASFSHPTNLTELAPEVAGVPTENVNDGWLKVRTTAYTHSERDHKPYGRKTARGNTLKYGKLRSAAADWSKFPVGTRFEIKGDPNIYEVDDYGSALVGKNTIDLYKPSLSSMNKWGCRHVPIRILKWGCFDRSYQIMRVRTHNKYVRRMVNSIKART